jgi:hypothetical protein
MTTPAIDYSALAQQAGAVSSAPPPTPAPKIDYSALAQQAGAVSSAPPPTSAISVHQPTGLERMLTGIRTADIPGVPKSAQSMVSGGIKDVTGMAGNILHMLNQPSLSDKAMGLEDKYKSTPGYQHVEDAANWLRSGGAPTGFYENLGSWGTQALELLGTDGLLKLAGGVPKAGEAVDAADHLSQAQNLAKTLKANPKIASLVSIGLKASKDALVNGAVQFAHTGNIQDALTAAAMGGATSATLGGIGEGLRNAKTPTVEIGGEQVPIQPAQLENGQITQAGIESAPKIQAAQQEAQNNLIANQTQQGLRKVLSQINATRPQGSSVAAARQAGTDAAEAIAARQGLKPGEVQPFTFEMEGPTTHEVAEPGSRVIGAPQEVRIAHEPGVGSRAIPAEEYTPKQGTPEASAATIYPPATVESAPATPTGNIRTTTNVNDAIQHLASIDDAIGDRSFDSLPATQQEAILAVRDRMQQQISMYHAANPSARFAPVDIGDLVKNVTSPGQAKSILQTVAQPVYDTMDEASGGDLAKYRSVIDKARKVIQDPSSMEAADAAEARKAEAETNIDQLFTQYGGQVQPQDYQMARMAWRYSVRYGDLNDLVTRLSNGITAEESAKGLQRITKGDPQQLENFLNKGVNRQDMAALIGDDGITNLKKMFALTSNAGTARATSSALKNVANELWHATHRPGFAGGVAGEMLGGHWAAGASAGAAIGATTYGMRKIFQFAANNPSVGAMLDTAVKNNVNPRLYAPLIARAIMQATGTPPAVRAPADQEPKP